MSTILRWLGVSRLCCVCICFILCLVCCVNHCLSIGAGCCPAVWIVIVVSVSVMSCVGVCVSMVSCLGFPSIRSWLSW